MTGFEPARAIITGAESGIGKRTAIALARAGLDIGFTWYFSHEAADETARLVRDEGRRCFSARLDATQDDAGAVVNGLVTLLGGVDVLVANAGAGRPAGALDVDEAAWRDVLAINLDGAFWALQAGARHMEAQGTGGRLIATTSVHALGPRVGLGPYTAAKFGLAGVVASLALELGQHAITVNAVAPGEINTAMNDNEDEPPLRRPGVPLGRTGMRDEVPAVISFLASPASSYITGVMLPVDGGMLIMGPHGGSDIPDDGWRAVGVDNPDRRRSS